MLQVRYTESLVAWFLIMHNIQLYMHVYKYNGLLLNQANQISIVHHMACDRFLFYQFILFP